MSGKLIVIDGADGSGKATQARLLTEKLLANQHEVETLDFPRYEENHFGKLLRECLDGVHGDFMSVHPKIASALYAADRYESKKHIQEWLDAGKNVVLDRYVSANMMHQGSKVSGQEELADFLTWLDDMEHKVFGIPRPDLIIYLEVPAKVRQELLFSDVSRKTIDVAELHEDHQLASEQTARNIVAMKNDWREINCAPEGSLRPREDIVEEIYEHVLTIL